MIEIKGIKDFNTDHIFDCGQCFRWNREDDGSYTGIAGENIANINFKDGTLYIDGSGSRSFWEEYLDLDKDYGKIKEDFIAKDDTIKNAIESGNGIRILNQDRWEALISFVISQNNNIPRIKGCIEKLCNLFGDYAGEFRGKKFFTFPDKDKLSELTIEDLDPVKLGYRAGYLVEISGSDFDTIKAEKLATDELYEYLLTLKGVGPKVANCILLFGFSRYDSFPVDVWMKRVMNRLYGFDENDIKGMQEFAKERFGEYGGIAQQYLFYYITHNME